MNVPRLACFPALRLRNAVPSRNDFDDECARGQGPRGGDGLLLGLDREISLSLLVFDAEDDLD